MALLPTPVADNSRGLPSDGTDFQSLPNALVALLPTPSKVDGDGGRHNAEGHQVTLPGVAREIALLPTPAVNDMGMAYTPEEWDAWTEKMKAKHGNGNGHGKSLNVEAQRLLPTPTRRDHKDSEIRREPHRPDDVDTLARALTDVPAALLPTPSVADPTGGHERRGGERGEELLLKGVVRAAADGTLLPTPRATDGTKGGPNQRGSSGDLMLPSAVNLLPTPAVADTQGGRKARSGDRSDELLLNGIAAEARWGEYEPAIRRWEAITRPAPAPTKLNSKGKPKLSDEFDEWLMGLPAGWITNVPGITWNETLKACGNGVVPQQIVAGLHYLRHLSRFRPAA